MSYYVIHEATHRVSEPFATAEGAIAAAKKLGARNAKFVAYGTFSGRPMYGTKTGWQVMPEGYVSNLRSVRSLKSFDDDNRAGGRFPLVERIPDRGRGARTRVIFADGSHVDLMGRLTKTEAIRNAEQHRGGYAVGSKVHNQNRASGKRLRVNPKNPGRREVWIEFHQLRSGPAFYVVQGRGGSQLSRGAFATQEEALHWWGSQ